MHTEWYSNHLPVLKHELLHILDPQIGDSFWSNRKYFEQACEQTSRNYMKSIATKLYLAGQQSSIEFLHLLKCVNQEFNQEPDLSRIKQIIQVLDRNSGLRESEDHLLLLTSIIESYKR